MNKDIWAVIPPDKSVAFGVVKPFHCTAHVCWAPRPGDGSLSFGENPADGSLRGCKESIRSESCVNQEKTMFIHANGISTESAGHNEIA
jgi:hypothetical protein